MAHEDETLPAADEGPVQRTVRPVQCVWCGKLFTAGGNMQCGALVPTHMAHGPNGAWCKTDDIVKMLETK